MNDIRAKDQIKKGTKKKHFDKENERRKSSLKLETQIDSEIEHFSF